jgi:hypothetical protein
MPRKLTISVGQHSSRLHLVLRLKDAQPSFVIYIKRQILLSVELHWIKRVGRRSFRADQNPGKRLRLDARRSLSPQNLHER